MIRSYRFTTSEFLFKNANKIISVKINYIYIGTLCFIPGVCLLKFLPEREFDELFGIGIGFTLPVNDIKHPVEIQFVDIDDF